MNIIPTNHRSILLLLAAGMLAAALSGCSGEAKKAKGLASADRYFNAGEYDKAEIEYKNVLQLDRKNSQALGRIGVIFLEQGRLLQAASVLKSATDLNPNNLEARVKLGYAKLAFGSRAEAQEAAIFVLERRPSDADAPLLLAEAVGNSDEAGKARAILQRVTPQTAPILTALGVVNIKERKLGEAEALFERARQSDPKYPQAHSGSANVYLAQKDSVRAEQSFTKAAELSPARSPIRLQLAHFLLQTGKAEVAKRMIDEVIRTTPDFLSAYLLRANIAHGDRQYDDSIALLEKLLARDSAQPEALMLMAQVRLAKGDTDKAVQTLEKAVSIFPQAAPIHYQLGNANIAKGDLAAATTNLNQALKLSANYVPAILALAQVNIRQRNFVAAVPLLQNLLKENTGNVEAQMLLAEAYRGQGNPAGALAIYRPLAENSPTNAQLQLIIGATLLQQDKKEEARRHFVKAREIAPNFVPALEQLVALDVMERRYDSARSLLQDHMAKRPEDAAPHLLLARIHFLEGNKEGAEAALKRSIELDPKLVPALSLLSKHYVQTGQVEKAVKSLDDVLAQNPKDVEALVSLGSMREQQKNFSAARDSYEKALALDANYGIALNNLAQLYAERFGELDKAQEMAQRARDVLPNHPATADTLGWILYQKNQFARALPLLEECTEKLPNNAEARYHVGMANYMLGKEADARSALELALKLDPAFPGAEVARQAMEVIAIDPATVRSDNLALREAIARRKDDQIALAKLASIYEREGNAEKAIATFDTALRASPHNESVALKLIDLYRTTGKADKALELARATRKLIPGNGRIDHALGRLSFDSGDFLGSVGILQDAARRQNHDPEVLFDLGRASYSVGRVSTAASAFNEALTLTPSFSRSGKARSFLEMIDIAQNSTPSADSMGKVDVELKNDPSSVPAIFAKGLLSEKKGDAKTASQHYEKALALYPEFTPAKRQLAIHYSLVVSDDKKGLELATKAREAFPGDAELAKAFGILLYRQEIYSRAAALLQESARTRSTDGEVFYYLGMSQRALKQSDAAARTFTKALELDLAPGRRDEVSRIVAETK